MKAPLGSMLAVLALAAGCQSTPDSSGNAGSAEGFSGGSSAGSTGGSGSGSGAAPNVVTAPAGSSQFSGFLGDYSQLKPAPDREGILLFIDRSADYRPFTKVMFDPVQMYVTPSAESSELPREQLARMSDGMLRSFKQALEPAYQVVSQPGPDVLRIRTAITGIQAVKPAAGAIDYLPVKALFNLGREAAGAGPRVPEMAAEIEVLDPSGKRVVAATATRKGETSLPQGGQITWNELQSINDYWAKGFRQRLDELRAAGPQG